MMRSIEWAGVGGWRIDVLGEEGTSGREEVEVRNDREGEGRTVGCSAGIGFPAPAQVVALGLDEGRKIG